MVSRAEAVIELVARGEQHVQDAFDETAESMEKVAEESEQVSSRFSQLEGRFNAVTKHAAAFAVASAMLTGAGVVLNRRAVEMDSSLRSLRFSMEAMGIASTQSATRVNEMLIDLSRASMTALPTLTSAYRDFLYLLRDEEAALIATEALAGLEGAFGESSREAAIFQAAMEGNEAAIVEFAERTGLELDAMSGPIEVSQQTWAKYRDEIGKNLTIMDRMKNIIGTVIDAFTRLDDKLGGILAPILLVSGAVLGVVAGLGGIILLIKPLIPLLGMLGTVLAAIGPIGWIVIGVLAALGIGAYFLWRNWDKVWNGIKDITSAVVNFLQNSPFRWLLLTLGPTGALILGLTYLVSNWQRLWSTARETVVRWWENVKGTFEGVWQYVSGVFTDNWQRAWERVVGIFDSLKKHFTNIWDGIRSIFEGIWQFVEGAFVGNWRRAWDSITSIAKSSVNAVIGVINTLIRAFNSLPDFTIPGWIPGIGGQTWGIPDIPEIPHLQRGTQAFRGGPAIVGEAGPELVTLPRGAQVTPMTGTQHLTIILDGEVIAEKVLSRFAREVRLQGV